MRAKILLIALSAGLFSSCSTAYKSGQTPDDVYYSPVKVTDDNNQNDNRDEAKTETNEDKQIRMGIRDPRWRDLNNDSYDYDNSPYHYCTCNCKNYGYYYNPAYHPWPIYITKVVPVNTTPRMVNLNAYTGYNSTPVINPKTGTGINWVMPSGKYNNSNSSSTRQTYTPSGSSSSNSTRTYSPSSSSSSSSSSGSSSSGKSSSGSVSRPKRGG